MLKRFDPDAILFREGDPSDEVILICSGSAEVLRAKREALEIVRAPGRIRRGVPQSDGAGSPPPAARRAR